MIQLQNLTKIYRTRTSVKKVADNITVTFPTGTSVALLGRNGAGKSTLLRMIAGTVEPDSGQVVSDGRVSWPVGFAGSFHRHLTGSQNVRFIARVYGMDTDALSDFVEDFAALGDHFYMPLRSYSSGMRSRLAFGVSMGIPFDTYLVDEVTSVGDAAFKRKSNALFRERMEKSSAVVVSHSGAQLRKICNAAALLDGGQLTYYEDIDEAIAQHKANMETAN